MEAIWFVIGLVVGIGFAAIHVRQLRRKRDAERQLAASTESERAQLEIDSGREIATLTAKLEAEEKAGAEQVKTVTEAMDKIVAVTKQSAGEELAERGRELVENLKAESVKPVTQLLEKMGGSLEELDREHRKSNTELKTQIEGLASAQSDLRSEASTLSKALRQPHTRGRWGETHLRRLVEAAGMSEHCDFTEQVSVDGEEGVLRPDVVFHLPGSREMVTDSKAPLSPFMDACEAADEAAKSAHVKMFARGLRAHVKKLASKDYSAQFEHAPDFVIMYLPGDHFLDEALASDRELFDDAIAQGVIIATPSSMISMLKTVAYSWQQQRATAEAEQILSIARQLYERLGKHLEHVDLVGKRLNSAVEAHNNGVGSLEKRLLPTARRLPELGAVGADAELARPRDVPITARRVQAPELEAGEEEITNDEGREAA